MNTDDVKKQHLRELLTAKTGPQADNMDWTSASSATPRPDFSAPTGPSATFPPQRGWNPVDGSGPVRGQCKYFDNILVCDDFLLSVKASCHPATN